MQNNFVIWNGRRTEEKLYYLWVNVIYKIPVKSLQSLLPTIFSTSVWPHNFINLCHRQRMYSLPVHLKIFLFGLDNLTHSFLPIPTTYLCIYHLGFQFISNLILLLWDHSSFACKETDLPSFKYQRLSLRPVYLVNALLETGVDRGSSSSLLSVRGSICQ